MKIFIAKLESPFGVIYLASSDDGLVQIGLSTEEKFLVELDKKYPVYRQSIDSVVCS